MGCASSAPPPQQNGGIKVINAHPQHHHQQYPQHQQQYPPQQQHHPQQFPPQQPMHQPPPYQQAPPPQHQPPPPQHQPPRQQPPPPQPPPPQSQPPPQPPAQPATQEENDEPPKPVELNQGVVDTLIDLESRISAYERRNVIKQYELKSNQVNMLQKQVQTMVAKQQQLDAQTQKEHQDVVNLQQNSTTQQMMMSSFAQQMNKEQEEYVHALNRSEIHKKELDNATRQLDSLKASIQPVQKESEELKQLYDQQDSLLASIFNGKYGSEKEYKLESNLDLMMEKKQRISVAKYKWSQSRQLISHAVQQMGFGVRRWNDAIQVPPQNSQLRYSCAAEARNNFVAAFQNIASSQSYLSTIKFPYCTPQEMQTLNLAIQHIFTDLLTVDRHKHAMECYVVVYKRSAALVQWFDFVINKTIVRDNEKINQECSSLQRELKVERMNLIKEKVREKLGDEAADKIEIKEGESTATATQPVKEEIPGDDDKEPEIATLAVIDADAVSQSGELAEMKTESTDLANAPTPLPLKELAPAPNMDDIFGNIEQLKKQHEEQQQEYEKQQEVAKARADQGLQDKLAQRRSRRRRMQANEAESQALGAGGGNDYYDLMG